ncbi:MAG: Uma2 family endonuclease [Polyangiaceae bacterium]|nr:Uma2 family endonuclease [Polyangiaceae bacterium]
MTASPAAPALGTSPAAPRSTEQHDHIVVLPNATWADYQRVLELRGERAVPRVTYLEGRLEIMSPSKSHESIKSMIGRLVEAWCAESGFEITPYGSWTLEAKDNERGLEPDECYVVGDRPEATRPDLAIEVVWTSGGIDKLDVYRLLGVREVWYWRDGAIEMFALRGLRYERTTNSEVLPGIDLGLLERFIDVRPMTRAVREYRAAIVALP